MASFNGDIGTPSGAFNLQVEYSYSQSISGNYSDVTATGYVKRNRTSVNPYNSSSSSTLTINGESSSYTGSYDLRSNGYKSIVSKTVRVYHNTDGTKSINISFSFNGKLSSYYPNGSISQTITLPTIPRYASITSFSVAKRDETSVTYNWSANATCDYAWYSKDNGSTWNALPSNNIVSGLNANTTYNFKLRVRRQDSQLTTDSGTVQQTTYSYPSFSTQPQYAARTETTLDIYYKPNMTIDAAQYRIITSDGNYGNWTNLTVISGTWNTTTGCTFRISGLSPNTNYRVQMRINSPYSDTWINSNEISSNIYTYDYPYCIEAPNFTVENNVTIKLYNPLNRTVRIQMWSHVSGQFVSDLIQVSGTSYTGFSNVANRLYASIPNTTTSKYNIDVWYENNKAIKEGGNYSINANVCKPTFSNFEYSTDLSELTGDNETIINGKTNTTVLISSINKAIGKNSATILRYSIQCGTQTPKLVNYSNSDVSVVLNNCNSDIIKVTAIDSRGLETTINKTIPNFKNYFVPTFVSFNVDRENGIDERAYLDLRLQFWNYNFGDEDNIIKSISYRVKEQGTDVWSNWFITNPSSWVINEEQLTITNLLVFLDGVSQGFTIGKTYNLQLQVIDGTLDDDLTITTSDTFNLTDGKVALSILKDSNGEYHLGINGMPDLNLNLKVHGTIQYDS